MTDSVESWMKSALHGYLIYVHMYVVLVIFVLILAELCDLYLFISESTPYLHVKLEASNT